MQKKYQIFISSTYEDLKTERQKIQDAILSMYHFPIGMEMFSAGDEDQWKIIQETIDSSDYYVLIIGHRYGSIIKTEDGEISYTQKEFRYALSKGIPVLAFLIAGDALVTPQKMEQDSAKKKKLEKFKKEVRTGRTVEWWSTPDDLAAKFTIALNKQIARGMDAKEYSRNGWVRNTPNDFLYSLDTNPEQDFSKIILHAKRVTIIGRTAVNILNQFEAALKKSLQAGCEYRILAYDYKEKNQPKYSVHSYNNHNTAYDSFMELQKEYPNLDYRETDKWPGNGILSVEYEREQDNYIQILLYPHTMKGSQRPMFKITPGNGWYENFSNEIHTLWNNAGKDKI